MSQPGSAKIDWLDEYQALTARAGVVELGHRTRIELTGNDRATFLHNLCTNEIRKLPAGAGCEAFFTTVQGKTLGHGLVFAAADALVVDTVAGQAETLLAHLNHYLVCEQVELTDRSQERFALLLSGPDSQRVLETVDRRRHPADAIGTCDDAVSRKISLARPFRLRRPARLFD